MMENKDLTRKWHLIDMKGKVLGRAATEIAILLRGKNKVDFAPNNDNGDFVVAINAEGYILTGNKEDQKRYYKHTGYLGNMKTNTVADLKTKKPGEILKKAVNGMLPKNRLQKELIKRLKIFVASEHTYLDKKFVK